MNNLVYLIGRLTKDTELRVSQSGNKITKGTLAVSRNFKNVNGEYETDFINFTCYGSVGERINEYCLKGDLIGIHGRLQTGSYEDKEGKKHYTMDVIADRVTFLSSKPKGQNEEKKEEEPITSVKQDEITTRDPFEEFSNEVVIDENDLPF